MWPRRLAFRASWYFARNTKLARNAKRRGYTSSYPLVVRFLAEYFDDRAERAYNARSNSLIAMLVRLLTTSLAGCALGSVPTHAIVTQEGGI